MHGSPFFLDATSPKRLFNRGTLIPGIAGPARLFYKRSSSTSFDKSVASVGSVGSVGRRSERIFKPFGKESAILPLEKSTKRFACK